MDRRDFIRRLGLGLAGVKLVDLTPAIPLWNPHPAQIRFLTAQNKLYPALWGIPYHESNASSGVWLGIHRIDGISKEYSKLIEIINTDKE